LPTADEMSRQFPAGTVSASELAHPLSRKASKLLLKAQNYLDSGDCTRAIDTLQLALKEPSAVPYAHSILGTEYLKAGRVADAIAELEQAVQLLPQQAANRSNLGYALYLAGERERAEREVRKALAMDSGNSKTRFVLNLIERGRGQ
jgi:Flp pilus assembly protein TadD